MTASGDLTDDTDWCLKCGSYRDRYAKENLLAVHTRREVICAGKKSPLASEKKKTLQKLEKIVSALRNSGGGQVVVHIDGQNEEDRYLEYFDEFITKSFTDLIEDGQQYVEAFDRKWLSEVESFESFTSFLLINVQKSFGIATVDFNTKVKNDIENNKPSDQNIAKILLKKASTSNETHGTFPTLPDVQQLHENRRTEIKRLQAEKVCGFNSLQLVDYIWNDLKLKENLTSLSKVPGGGSYYVGISEHFPDTKGYRTKIPKVEGFEATNKTALIEGIKEKIRESVLVLKGRIFSDAPEDLIKIRFHVVPNTKSKRHVLEVSIRYFDGIVFYDKKGPRTYKIQGDEIVRVGKDEWLDRFLKKCDSCGCHNQDLS